MVRRLQPLKTSATANLVMILAMATVACGCTGMMHGVCSDSACDGSVYSLVLKDTDGKRVDFSRYRGKVLMLNLFTTWSQPSVISMPGYGALYRKYRDQGLRVVGIGMDKLGSKVLVPFVQGMQIDFPVLLASKKIIEGKSVFGNVSVIPTLLLFGRSGRLKWVFVGLIKEHRLEGIIRDLL